jgi:hypothetical protein
MNDSQCSCNRNLILQMDRITCKSFIAFAFGQGSSSFSSLLFNCYPFYIVRVAVISVHHLDEIKNVKHTCAYFHDSINPVCLLY